MNPIKRNESLQPLSREHHYSLLLCWKIRMGIKKNVEVSRIKKYVDWFYEYGLKPHFEMEEKLVFPILGQNHELIKRAIAEHNELRELFAIKEPQKSFILLIERKLQAHIRFEERALFTEIEKVDSIKNINIAPEYNKTAIKDESWGDEFWV